MTDRWLRHSEDGFIYGWTEGLAKHPMLREVTAQEAFPELNIPVETVVRIAKGRQKPEPKKKFEAPDAVAMTDIDEILQSFKDEAPISTVAGLDLGVMDFDEHKFHNPELDAEASRGLD